MKKKLWLWLIGDVGKSESNKLGDHLFYYFELLERAAILIFVFVLLFIAVTVIQWVAPPGFLSIELKLDGQTLSNYAGIFLGAVVALAGSLVAIVLASRAQNTSEETKKLQEIANRQALGERPEYVKAFEAATAYAAFKGYIILSPMTLRKLQRNGTLGEGVFAGAENGNSDLKQLQFELTKRLFDSILVSLLPSLAFRSKEGGQKGEIAQRLIEGKIAAVQNSDHFLLGLHASLQLAKEIDQLIDDIRICEKCDTYDKYVESLKNDAEKSNVSLLTEVEFWFVRHVLPYTKINREIFFGGDIEPWFKKARDNLINSYDLEEPVIVGKFPDAEFLSVRVPIVTASIADYGPYELKRKIMERSSAQIDICANQWEFGLVNFLRKHSNGSERILILDQIELYEDSNSNTPDGQSFTLSQHLHFWKMCRLLDNAIKQKTHWKFFKEWLSKNGTENVVDTILSPSKCNQRIEIYDRIYNKDEVELADLDSEVLSKIEAFRLELEASKNTKVADDSIVSSKRVESLSNEAKGFISEIAKIPLFERPLYGWRSGPVSWEKVHEDILPEHLYIAGNLYFNSKLDVSYNIIVEWLMAGAKGKVYWLD